MFQLNADTRYIVWGYKNVYDTHGHIHDGFYRALKYMGKDVEWLDETIDITGKDFHNCFVITNHACIDWTEDYYWPWELTRKSKLPIYDDSFYCVHGLHDHPKVNALFYKHSYNLSWNVLTMRAMRKGLGLPFHSVLQDEIYLDDDVPFSLPQRYMEFRWATNLTPDEIEANKPTEMLSLKNRVVNWVGTMWWVNNYELSEFAVGCIHHDVEFKHYGAGQNGVMSNEENQRLVRESYMAPAISGGHHLTEGYVPCRIFKNISYGQMGVTNNPKTNELFGGKLIYEANPYKLFYEAQEQLKTTTVNQVHELMDIVKEKHTYLNRISVLIQAAQMISNG